VNEGNPSHPARNRAKWWTAVIALAALTAISATISYLHAYAVLQAAHNTGLVAVLGPVVPDLVIAVCSMAYLEARASDAEWPKAAIAALVAFIGVTVALNWIAGLQHGRGSALIAVLFPISYLVGLHILAGMIKRGRTAAFPGPAGGGPATTSHPQPLSTEAALRALVDSGSQRQLAELLGVPRSRIQAWTGRLVTVAEDSRPVVAPGTAVPAGEGHLDGDSPPAPPGAHQNGQVAARG
jgi:hypothetical protein